MKKSPTIINFFEKTKKCCQTFLSSCCDYDSRKTTSKPSSILVHRYQPMPAEPEFTNPFVNILNQQRPEPKTILYPNGAIDNAELLKKFNLETGLAPYEAPVPLSSLQIEKQKNAISKIIYSPELTPIPNPTLRSTAPSPEPMDPLKKDLEDIVNMFAGFGLEGEIGKINALEELSEIEKDLIDRSRSVGMSRSEARQLLKISTSQNTHHYQV